MCMRHAYTATKSSAKARKGWVTMPSTAKASGEIQGWDEETYQDLAGDAKLTRARVNVTFSGDIEGSGPVEWLMCYRDEAQARFVGLQHVDGRLGDRSGTFVVETVGTFDGKAAKASWNVIPGSGTGELSGLSGEGEFLAPLKSTPSVVLTYALS
jgi:Protein of unknown function (DUF3224)